MSRGSNENDFNNVNSVQAVLARCCLHLWLYFSCCLMFASWQFVCKLRKYLWKQKLKCTLFEDGSPISPLSSLPINIHKHCPVYQAWPLLQMSRSGFYSCDNTNPQRVWLSDVWLLEALVGQLITTASSDKCRVMFKNFHAADCCMTPNDGSGISILCKQSDALAPSQKVRKVVVHQGQAPRCKLLGCLQQFPGKIAAAVCEWLTQLRRQCVCQSQACFCISTSSNLPPTAPHSSSVSLWLSSSADILLHLVTFSLLRIFQMYVKTMGIFREETIMAFMWMQIPQILKRLQMTLV